MSAITNTSLENRNFVSEFYKSPVHDYDSFFGAYIDNDKITSINKEIKTLNDKLDSKREELTRLYSLRYNKMFTPIDGTFILSYESDRTGQSVAFDIMTGTVIYANELDNLHVYSVGRKAGDFKAIVGYCLPLGSVVSRHYEYKISSNNTHCSFILRNESLIPILEYDAPIVSDDGSRERRYEYNQSATDFIRKMYNLPNFNLNLTLRELTAFLEKNKSTEVILRTAPENIMKTLLDWEVDKAEPIYKILGLTKVEYDELLEKGMLQEIINVQFHIKKGLKAGVNQGLTEADFFHYSTSDWLNLIEKSEYWKEECDFNQVRLNGYTPLVFCLDNYLRAGVGFTNNTFYKYYSFGKFMDYVCEGACNQGFQSLSDFTVYLKDYINMCEYLEVKPNLYSGYLKQTHDILARNYKIKLTQEQEELFKKRYEDFKDYKTKDEVYIFTHPTSADDLKHEGNELNHCVGSYCNKILRGDSLIVFLRNVSTPAQSLVTIEICGKQIVQARGASNRSISHEEFVAICEYAKEKHFKVCVSPRD